MTGMKERLRAGAGPLLGFANLIPSPVATQAIAAAGADWVMLDQEHAPVGPESLHAMIAATAGTSCAPLGLVGRPDEALVKLALDMGAEGIFFPLVRSAEEAADCVALTRYPPAGRRGWGPFIAHSRWGTGFLDYADRRGGATVCGLLIETRAAVDRIEAICQVDGIDFLFIAKFDLSTDLGVSGQLNAPILLDAVGHVERVVREAGIPLGGAALSREQTRDLLGRGYRVLGLGFDVLMLKEQVRQAAEWCRGTAT